jgi:hypothetical protein
MGGAMTRKLFGTASALVLFVGMAAPARGWNSFGHMSVAYVAYQQLTPVTRTRVKALLKLNPYYKKKWSSMVPAGTSTKDKDRMIFMIAATWPDQIKSDNTYHNDGLANGDRPPNDPSAGQNIGYTDRARHKYWHFVDTPFSQDGTALPAVPTPNAQERIGLLRKVLASSDPDTLKSYDLSWLLHLVGDVHQPLHCATRVSATDADGDAGGNLVKLSCTGCSTELHAFWDNLLGTSSSLTRVVTSAKKLPAADATLAGKADEKDWVAESFEDAKQTVYVTPIGPGDGPFALTSTYKSKAKALAKERVALAGARLANLLNNELK